MVIAAVAVVQFVAIGVQTWFIVRTFRSTERTAIRQSRAYVSAMPNHIFNFSAQVASGIKVELVNKGLTPAYAMSTRGCVDVLPLVLPPDFRFPQIPAPVASTMTLHSGETFNSEVYATRKFTQAEIDNAIAGTGIAIYVFGVVSYVDTFGVARETEFCRRIPSGENLRIVATGGSVTDGKFAFMFTDQHNHAT